MYLLYHCNVTAVLFPVCLSNPVSRPEASQKLFSLACFMQQICFHFTDLCSCCFSALPHWRKCDLKHLFTFQVYFLNNTRVNARFKANAKALNQFIYTILNPGKTLCAAVESHRSSFHFWPVAGKRHGNVCGELNRMKDNLYRNRLINTPRNQNRQTLPCCMKSVIMRAWCWGDSLGPDRG